MLVCASLTAHASLHTYPNLRILASLFTFLAALHPCFGLAGLSLAGCTWLCVLLNVFLLLNQQSTVIMSNHSIYSTILACVRMLASAPLFSSKRKHPGTCTLIKACSVDTFFFSNATVDPCMHTSLVAHAMFTMAGWCDSIAVHQLPRTSILINSEIAVQPCQP